MQRSAGAMTFELSPLDFFEIRISTIRRVVGSSCSSSAT